ncbi:MAG: FG-GAP repeat protein [Myxococcales bacterium]|nr:MAG: FG-GAP repeat protein [Myxococcales bacterium]
MPWKLVALIFELCLLMNCGRVGYDQIANSQDGGDADAPVSLDAGTDGNDSLDSAQAPTCSDGVQNQDETDVDCGGSTCAACAAGQSCNQSSDCFSNACATTCAATVGITESLRPPDPTISYQYFGDSMDLSANRMIIGATEFYPFSPGTGHAYVYERQGNGSWLLEDTLSASDGALGDAFGASVTIDGDYAVVGAPNVDGGGFSDIGAAYIYERQGNGSWLEVTKLTQTPADYTYFGGAVEMDGDLAYITRYRGSVGGGNFSGGIYVYRRTGPGSWSSEDTLGYNPRKSPAEIIWAIRLPSTAIG